MLVPSIALLALLSVPAVFAQHDCNPLTTATCPPIKGLSTSTYTVDFTQQTHLPDGWVLANYANVTFGPEGAKFWFNGRGQAPYIWTDFYVAYGRVDVEMLISNGTGIITSSVLFSDSQDEIDWEFSGSNFGTPSGKAFTNYFGKGLTGNYDRASIQDVQTPQQNFHTYSFDWTTQNLKWIIDGAERHSQANTGQTTGNYQYPQTPSRLHLGMWDAGDPNTAAGTVNWAGGYTNYANVPYYAVVRSVKISTPYPCSSWQYPTNFSGKWADVKCTNQTIPSSTTSAAPIITSGTSSTSTGSLCTANSYSVIPGDYGWGIANRFGLSFAALSAANAGLDWDQLNAGQILNVPCNITTSTSSSLSSSTTSNLSISTSSLISTSASSSSTTVTSMNNSSITSISTTQSSSGATTSAALLTISSTNSSSTSLSTTLSTNSSSVSSSTPSSTNSSRTSSSTLSNASPSMVPNTNTSSTSFSLTTTTSTSASLNTTIFIYGYTSTTSYIIPSASAAALYAQCTSGMYAYTVKPGDYAARIADWLGIKADYIYQANPSVNWMDLKVYQVLQIPCGKSTFTSFMSLPTSTTTSMLTSSSTISKVSTITSFATLSASNATSMLTSSTSTNTTTVSLSTIIGPPLLNTPTTSLSSTSSSSALTIVSLSSIVGPPLLNTPTTSVSSSKSTSALMVSSTNLLQGWKYKSCFTDNLNPRSLNISSDIPTGQMNNTRCINYCDSKGYIFAGTEWSGECYCGMQIINAKAADESQCNMKCYANNTEMCGGDARLSVYYKDTGDAGNANISPVTSTGRLLRIPSSGSSGSSTMIGVSSNSNSNLGSSSTTAGSPSTITSFSSSTLSTSAVTSKCASDQCMSYMTGMATSASGFCSLFMNPGRTITSDIYANIFASGCANNAVRISSACNCLTASTSTSVGVSPTKALLHVPVSTGALSRRWHIRGGLSWNRWRRRGERRYDGGSDEDAGRDQQDSRAGSAHAGRRIRYGE